MAGDNMFKEGKEFWIKVLKSDPMTGLATIQVMPTKKPGTTTLSGTANDDPNIPV